MTTEFENMLYLFGCGALGKEADVKNCTEIKKIKDIAVKQNSWAIVYSTLRKKLMDASVKIPPEIYAELEKAYFSGIALNIQKLIKFCFSVDFFTSTNAASIASTVNT